MPLSASEVRLLDELEQQRQMAWVGDERLQSYYQGRQRVENLGMAIPQAMRAFTVIVNWPRVVVDTVVDRQQIKAMFLPGQEADDPTLRAIAEASNFTSHVRMFNRDRCVYGRGLMSVSANPRGGSPLIRVESPREMVARIDPTTETIAVAARFFGVDHNGMGPTHATLFLPDYTVWAMRGPGAPWVEYRRDQHRLGVVPVVMHLNRRLSTGWVGESQMKDVIPLTDSAVRALTNLQFTQEAHGAPRKWVTGATMQDFTDEDGKPAPAWEAYFDAIHILTKEGAKIGQLDAADLKNFETAVELYGKQAATVTGFPARYFGLHTANPPAEGAIYADEAQLVRSVEAQNDEVGTTLGWVGGLALRIATGSWVEGNRVRVEWHNPATPTIAQRMDAVVKAKQSGILSREGSWDELGWSPARKDRERAYFAAEANDPTLRLATSLLNGTAHAAAGNA